MNPGKLFGASFAGLVLLLALPVGSGCGVDVATCAYVCGLPEAPQGCDSTCPTAQGACADPGEFQAYLTCIANAGTYKAILDRCASVAAAVANDCNGSGLTTLSDAGGGGGTTGETCAVGAACPNTTATCTNVGVGPCSSSQILRCDDSLHYVLGDYACQADSLPCVTDGGTCDCVGGTLVCAGFGADAG